MAMVDHHQVMAMKKFRPGRPWGGRCYAEPQGSGFRPRFPDAGRSQAGPRAQAARGSPGAIEFALAYEDSRRGCPYCPARADGVRTKAPGQRISGPGRAGTPRGGWAGSSGAEARQTPANGGRRKKEGPAGAPAPGRTPEMRRRPGRTPRKPGATGSSRDAAPDM